MAEDGWHGLVRRAALPNVVHLLLLLLYVVGVDGLRVGLTVVGSLVTVNGPWLVLGNV